MTDYPFLREPDPQRDGGEGWGVSTDAIDPAVDRELEAAIEYKLATAGPAGIESLLDMVEVAIRRRGRSR